MSEDKPTMIERLFEWLAGKIASYLVIGTHCDPCGKRIPDVITTSWTVIICDACYDEGYEQAG